MKIKALLILSLVIISLGSCRKDRTCTCTTMTEGYEASTNTLTYSTTADKRTVKKVTKRQALGGECASTESQLDVDTYHQKSTTECKLD
jgi:outer membrane lipoprotein SlyB